nr:hypothetical protein [Actinospica durhamensis]
MLVTAKGVAQEVDPASLVGGAEHDLADRFDQAEVVVTDDGPDAGQAAFAQETEDFGPEQFGLAVADHHAEHLAAAVLGNSGGDDHGPGVDLVLDPGLAVGRVEVDEGNRTWSKGRVRNAVSTGKKLPDRNLGIDRSRSPTCVVRVLSR